MTNQKNQYNYVKNVVDRIGLDKINEWILYYNNNPLIKADDSFYTIFNKIKTLNTELKLLFITWIINDYDYKQTSVSLLIPAPTVYSYITKIKNKLKSND